MTDFIDHSDEIKAKLSEAIGAALEGAGSSAVGLAKRSVNTQLCAIENPLQQKEIAYLYR